MSSRPSLPPRRSVPSAPVHDEEEAEKPMGIAARIASLKLDQSGSGSSGRHPLGKPPPPVPRAKSERTAVPPNVYLSAEELEARGPDFLRLITRIPPAPPDEDGGEVEMSAPPPPPARRLPPMLAASSLPTPPPEPEPEPEPVYATESCLKCHDFSYVDHHASQFPRHTVSSLSELAHSLTSPFPSETEKCRALFTWMHHNIAYDTAAFFSGNLRPATASSTLQSGLAVCDGYAGLFVALAECVGIQAHKVGGHGKGFGFVPPAPGAPPPPFEGNHAWNCALMDGEWRLIDCCWGAGALEGTAYNPRFTPSWFSSSPLEFGRRHFPEDPGYQLGEAVSWEEYILEPEGPVVFNDFYELNFNPYIIVPAEKHIQGGTWVSFQIFKFCEHMSTEEVDNYVYFVNTPDQTRTPLNLNGAGGWGADIYIPNGAGELSLYYVTQCDGQDGKGLGVNGFLQANGRKAMKFGGMCRWTVV